MPVRGDVAVVAGERVVVVGCSKRAAGITCEEGHRVAAAVGKVRVERSGNRDLIEILGANRQIVGEKEVAPRPPVVAYVQRDAPQDLVLNGQAELPVVRPNSPPVLDVGVHSGRAQRVAEVQVGPRAAVVAAGRQIVLRGRIQQVAIRSEITVAVGPAAIRGLLEGHGRIVDGV